MTSIEKIRELQSVLKKALLPLINEDYVLLDLPYHANLGDTLIWEGELCFLKQVKHRCLYSSNLFCYRPLILAPETIILLHGGGNFGDVWPSSNEFRKQIIESYPHNKVIIFPQTVFYNEEANLQADADFYRKYPNVTICVRDEVSYELMNNHFGGCEILLLPDMAFFVDAHKKSVPQHNGKCIYVKRNDIELLQEKKPGCVPASAAVSDWPAVMSCSYYKMADYVNAYTYKLNRLFHTEYFIRYVDSYWYHVLRKLNTNEAIKFLDAYDSVYTTRLHAGILSVLLNKPVTLLDNSYGKNSSFYQTWLSDCDNIQLAQ